MADTVPTMSLDTMGSDTKYQDQGTAMANDTQMDYSQYAFEDYNTSAHYYIGEIQQAPTWEIIVKIIAYVIIMVLSLVGNMLVVYIVWHNKRMRTTTNFFIVNLAVSDLMVTSSCTWVHLVDDLTEGWVLGAFFCKVNSFMQGQSTFYIFSIT